MNLKVAQPAEPPAKAPAPPPPDHLRILLVEDYADTRAVLAQLLGHQGHTVLRRKILPLSSGSLRRARLSCSLATSDCLMEPDTS